MEAKQKARPKLGQRVKTQKLVYKSRDHRKVKWESCGGKPIEGIYIGYRDKCEGRIETDDDGWGREWNYFTFKNTVRVWVIVTNERHNPVYVLPEDCEWG